MHEYLAGTHPMRTQPVLGHEFSGVIVEVGNDVTNEKVVDRVAVEPLIPCGKCDNCQRGLTNLCTDRQGYGYTVSGGFAQFAS